MTSTNNNGFAVIEAIICILIIFLMGSILLGFFMSSETEARLYNDKYGTHYTQADFIWSGDVIKSFLNGGQQTTQNLNINGVMPVKVVQ